MKQLLQDANTGELNIAEVPAPQLLPGCVLVRTAASLVSAGTERASAEFARKNFMAKAKARPDLVRDVFAKLQRDGLLATVSTVRSRLSLPQVLGYSSAGVVIAAGDGVNDVQAGERVACAGAGYAAHAELACVPRLLLSRIPDTLSGIQQISFEQAAFATVGAICLHGIRTAEVTLGDTVAVIGLGLLGQVTVQLLKAAGCRVLGMDLAKDRAGLALQSGADQACSTADEFRDLCFQRTGGAGVDAILITAETPSSNPVNLAADVARDRAIVVAVGTVGMDIERKLYYEKELDFRISRSYGPGRYDTVYEQKGRDYPIGHVRWTETRNMEAFLRLVAEGKLNLPSLITHRFPVQHATRAYDVIKGRAKEPFLGVLLTYGTEAEFAPNILSLWSQKIPLHIKAQSPLSASTRAVGLGVLGAGAFAQSTLLPTLKSIPEVFFVGVCNATGPRSRTAAEKFGFSYCSSSEEDLLRDPNINAVLIATRHHRHASQTLAALKAGKSVFCEKPLCLREDELHRSSVSFRSPSDRSRLPLPAHGRLQSPLRTHGHSIEEFSVHHPRTAFHALSRECRIPFRRSLGQRSRAGRRPHSRRGLPFHRLPLLPLGLLSH